MCHRRLLALAIVVATLAGLDAKRGTRLSWTWKVGTRTTPGRWPIVVGCGAAATLRTSFVVS
jgi:hypothetical protein